MRTTIDLDDELVREVMALLGVKTKREAVRHSLEVLIQQKRRERLRAKLGKMDLALSLKDLEKMRRDEGRRDGEKIRSSSRARRALS